MYLSKEEAQEYIDKKVESVFSNLYSNNYNTTQEAFIAGILFGLHKVYAITDEEFWELCDKYNV